MPQSGRKQTFRKFYSQIRSKPHAEVKQRRRGRILAVLAVAPNQSRAFLLLLVQDIGCNQDNVLCSVVLMPMRRILG